jgi:hypothetical protein
MKTKFLILIVALVLINCAKNKETNIMQNPNINANNFVEEITKNIKNYNNEPIYIMSYEKYYCLFDISINNMSAFKRFDVNLGSSAFDVNPTIFKSGKYDVKYKMYPVSGNKFKDNTFLKLGLESYELKTGEDEKKLFEHKTPSQLVKISDGYTEEKFIAAGKDYYESSFEIDVKVPYELKPDFEDAQDLRKVDKKELEKNLLVKYNQIKEIYQNKEIDNIARLIYSKTIIEFQTTYSPKEKIQEYWKLYRKIFLDEDFKMLPIENYKVEYFYDGRLVALISQSKEPKLRGEPALAGEYNNQISSIKHYLYLPKGETEFKVY